MCVGSVAVLVEAWQDGTHRAGRLDDGCVVSLAFTPDAQPGDHVLLHLGIPVEVVEVESEEVRHE
jgi:hypothetical protein